MLRYIALLVLVAGASAHLMPKCPKVIGMYPFDMDQFQGDWYLAAATEKTLEKRGKCGKFVFPTYAKDDKIEDTVLTARYSGVKDGAPMASEVIIQPMFSDKVANLYSVYRKEGTSEFSNVMKVAIASSDYKSFAVFVGCKLSFNSEAKKFEAAVFGEIWTREGVTLSQDTYNALTTQLASYGIDAASIKQVEKC
ncbi:hypothetical protein FOCC_FOCC011757 [Frankliniella occidentalis]|uniref:Bilin-binding protein-like n=1 Tax=Frankliniella occidentalis TaxID=133901 RepID=A0A6J1S4R7_FRAOC|nr:bilin-binding protein-like [Frankliniella occidentalis]KAE8742725.1 hypothetical protein FOCC_FOCC011757 [Frankliniella occidentalis]